jgi:hypothetical protein
MWFHVRREDVRSGIYGFLCSDRLVLPGHFLGHSLDEAGFLLTLSPAGQTDVSLLTMKVEPEAISFFFEVDLVTVDLLSIMEVTDRRAFSRICSVARSAKVKDLMSNAGFYTEYSCGDFIPHDLLFPS